MKRAVLIVFLIVFALSSCADPTVSGELPEASPPEQTPSPSGIAPTEPSPSGTVPAPPSAPVYPWPEKIDTALPPAPEYRPEIGIVPLTNIPRIYGTCVVGWVSFITKDLKPVALPSTVTNYEIIHDYSDYVSPSGVVLWKNERFAVMRLDGEIVTDFIYEGFTIMGGDYWDQPCYGGYLQVMRRTGRTENTYGLLDIRTGEEVVPCEYEEMTLLNGCFIAVKDGNRRIYDYSGKPFFDCGTLPLHINNHSSVEIDYYFQNGYTLFTGTGELYRSDLPPDMTSRAFGDLLVCWDDNRAVWVYDRTGEVVFEMSKHLNHGGSSEAVVIPFNNTAYIVTTGGVTTVPLPGDLGNGYNRAVLENGVLVVTQSPGIGHNYIEYTTLDLDGNILSVRIEETAGNWSAKGHVWYALGKGYRLVDDGGHTVIPEGLYDRLDEIGEFVLCRDYLAEDNWGEVRIAAITDHYGRTLVESPLGAVFELAFPGTMVVYKDKDTCGLMYPDGRFEPISCAPEVTVRYYGG